MVKVAICLYGQARNYLEGYKAIKKIIDGNQTCSFDIFYHVWFKDPIGNEIEKYESSPWRKIPEKELIISRTIPEDLNSLYKPIKFKVECPRYFDNDIYKNSEIFYRTSYNNQKNINNTTSQMYSRSEVRNLLATHDEKYDIVITTRFDYVHTVHIDIEKLNLQKTYVSAMVLPRKFISDNFIIMPYKVYLKTFNIYSRLIELLENKEVDLKMTELGERFCFNAEELIFASYLESIGSIDDLIYTSSIHC